jgi:ABC-2 type transport system permease protein
MNGIIPVIRNPITLIFTASTPLTILFLLSVAGPSNVAFAVSGSIVFVIASNGIAVGSDATLNRVEYKFQDILVASPVSPLSYATGLALSALAFSLPMLGLFAIVGVLASGQLNLPLFTLAVLMSWATMSFVGFILSTFVLNSRSAYLVVSSFAQIISVVPPVFYQFDVLPPPLREIAFAVPTAQAAELFRQSFGIQQEFSVAGSLAILSAYSIISVLLLKYKARWREP